MSDDPFEDLPDFEDDLARAEQRLTVRTETRRYGKPVTIVEGFDSRVVDVEEVASALKRALATGGTVDDGTVELQGNHAARVPDLLRAEGFEVED
ncbi:MAG: translation initiation factor [Haloferacaceae archaeon]